MKHLKWKEMELWEDEQDRQCIERICQNISFNSDKSMNFVESLFFFSIDKIKGSQRNNMKALYYNHGIHSIIDKYLNQILKENKKYWVEPFIQLLFIILKRKEIKTQRNIRMYWISLNNLPNFIADCCIQNNIDVFEINNISLINSIVSFEKNKKDTIELFFLIDESFDLENEIKVLLNEFPLLYIAQKQFPIGNNFICIKNQLELNVYDLIQYHNDPIRLFILDFIYAVTGTDTIPMETECLQQNLLDVWKDKLIEKTVDQIENAFIEFTVVPSEIKCIFNNVSYNVTITTPLNIKQIIHPINPHFSGEYILSVPFVILFIEFCIYSVLMNSGGNSMTLRINPGAAKRYEFVYEKEMKAGSVQTIIFKSFDCYDNITSIGLLQMKLTHNNKELFIEVEQSKIGYISCTPVLYDAGEYHIIVLNDIDVQVDEIQFIVIPREISDSLTQVTDDNNTLIQKICLIEKGIKTTLKLQFYDQFNNQINEHFELLCESDLEEIECKNNQITIQNSTLGEYTLDVKYINTNISVYGFPKTVMVIEKEENNKIEWSIPKKVVLGELLTISCTTSIKRIDLINVEITINNRIMRSMIIQTTNGFLITCWCIQFGEGTIKINLNNTKKEETFIVVKEDDCCFIE